MKRMKKLSILLLVSVQMSLNAQDFVINESRVNDLMTALSAFKEEDNNSRVAFSDADLEGRAFVMQKMKEDYGAISRNRVGGLGTLAIKNLSKLGQFTAARRK